MSPCVLHWKWKLSVSTVIPIQKGEQNHNQTWGIKVSISTHNNLQINDTSLSLVYMWHPTYCNSLIASTAFFKINLWMSISSHQMCSTIIQQMVSGWKEFSNMCSQRPTAPAEPPTSQTYLWNTHFFIAICSFNHEAVRCISNCSSGKVQAAVKHVELSLNVAAQIICLSG